MMEKNNNNYRHHGVWDGATGDWRSRIAGRRIKGRDDACENG